MSQVYIVSAPSGSGKSTLVNNLLAWDRSMLFSISYTTREPRGHEKDGCEYNFVSTEEFVSMRDRGEFLEWAAVHDAYYGTHRRYVEQGEAEGRDVVLDIDVRGARQLREKIPGSVSVFILAPSRQELEKRLRARGDVSDEVIARRLAQAAREIADFRQYDHVLVNDEVALASRRLIGIVESVRMRSTNAAVQASVARILATFD